MGDRFARVARFEREPEPMLRHRTTARLTLSLLLLWALAATANAAPPKRIVFPVVGGGVTFTDDFGDPRGQGGHQGNDLMAPWRAAAVAVEAGRISIHDGSWRAGCMLYLYGRSGTTYLYVHLNNDLTADNDNKGGCENGVAFPRGLRDGQRVTAGQLIGYVGDSGDADGIDHHLHFELHPNGGGAVSPYPWLKSARRLLFPRPTWVDQVSLKVMGEVRWVDGQFAVRVERVRLSTGWRSDVRRTVVVTVPPEATVEREAGNGPPVAAAAADAAEGERVVVWTTSFEPTLKHQLARPGELVAARVLLRGAG